MKFKIPAALGDEPVMLLGLGIIAVLVLYQVGKGIANGATAAASAAANTVGGLASGNNALTQGTPYQGAGVLGTLGAAFNDLLGGAPQSVGDWASSYFDSSSTAADTQALTRDQIVTNNSVNADYGGDNFGLLTGGDDSSWSL